MPLSPPPGPVPPSLLLQLLQQWVGFALRRLDAVCPHDAGGTVPVQHQDELLPLLFQLFYLGLQLSIHEL